ncbi:ribosomal protein [Hirsutella rhossiliensis]|uniref:Ribosomal protein l22p/L17e domain-containing protein n=1 Tax=Hirsutella rhossiliensis TaxID=111463 RepID=A0A9P8SM00_9HYPO|nr:ribosomal protein l22p/L17e domain-containing protein [Hirsutella rhossiliensis]KAH0967471.1 ribosomal protein l22p/L17e domain-containing protein [Hirsutella rhossiliensis]
MSARLAARRLALSGAPSSHPSIGTATRATVAASDPPPCTTLQRRHKWSLNPLKGWGSRSAKSRDAAQQSARDTAPELDDPKLRQHFLERNLRSHVEDNIFQDEIDSTSPGPAAAAPASGPKEAVVQKTRETMAMVADPNPRSRVRWQRNKVIQMVRNNGQLTKEDRIKMTERELVHKSHFLPTSLKKLVMLSRQIAGKPVDEAITQMRWSKKKMSAEMRYYLEEARDLAVAQRGMGLGKVNGESLPKPRKIMAKDGKWIAITDPTRIYVAQSWVGRGPWRGQELDYKGRGRHGLIQHPSTSFSVVLKEEKTRLREHDEGVAKKAAKGPWVHLPNRSIHGQRPYYSW